MVRSLAPARFFLLPGAALLLACWAFPVLSGGQTLDDSQALSAPAGAESPETIHGRLLLVLPFANHTSQPNLGWISDAIPEILNRRLASAGFLPISRDDRLYALDHLGLPESFQPSRASAIRLAQTLDADYVIVGAYSTTGTRLQASAQILNVDALHLSPPIEEGGDMTHLLNLLNSLAWELAKHIDPKFAVAQNTFLAADPKVNLAAFENYVRGLIDTDAAGGIDHLKEAVRLDPAYEPALFALGMAYFENQNYELAAATLGRLDKDDPKAREADFYRGLAYLYTGNYAKSEDAFAFVSNQLPLPEVVNNEGVAASRRGHDASSLFLKAAAADPTDPDYQFNLSVSLARKNALMGALEAVEKTLDLRPQDGEAQAWQNTLRAAVQHPAGQQGASPAAPGAGAPSAADSTTGDPIPPNSIPRDSIPLERVKRTFNEAAFRQAALEMEQVEAVRLHSLPPAQHAAKLTEEGTRFLDRGLVLEAEREFQAALQVDSANAGAYAGLAAVRERDGDADAARKEADHSLSLQPNIEAYLVLARLDLAANQLPGAAEEVSRALQLEPENSAARGLQKELEGKGQQIP